jgi:hypothetical protein
MEASSIDLIQDIGGLWSRPFVVGGDPFRIDVAIIGLNPATAITNDEATREQFHDLLLNRSAFEDFYSHRRLAKGKKGISPTRRRLRMLVEGYSNWKVTETNVNALPTPDEKALDRHPLKAKGERIATDYLGRIYPKLAIIHGAGVLDHLRGFGIVTHLAPGSCEQFITDYGASWNGRPCRVVVLPHLASRQKGWAKPVIMQIPSRYVPTQTPIQS